MNGFETILFSRLGSDPEKLFPFEMLMEHFRTFGKFGLYIYATLLLLLIMKLWCGVYVRHN